MRILTFTSLFPNSSDPTHGIFIYQRSSHLASRPGNEVLVVSPVPYSPGWVGVKRWREASRVPQEETIGALTVHHPRYFLLPKISMPVHALSMFLGSIGLVRRLHRTAKIDCIDAHFVYPDGLAAVLLGKVLKVPVTVSARGTDINLFPSFHLIRPMIRWTMGRANALIAVSRSLKEKMIALGADARKIQVIPNGVETDRFKLIGREEARRHLELPAEAPILVSVGALVPAKDHRLLIEAFQRTAERFPALRLYILGEGSLRAELEREVKERNLTDKIFLPGKRPNEELPFWFNAADASCLTSEREGWPNAATESLACGTPVVATGVGGVGEILHSPDLGIVTKRSVEDVAMGLEQALKKRWNREEISQQTRERTWAKVASEVEAVLKEQS